MVSGFRSCVIAAAFFGALAVLSGCSGVFFAQREPWRQEAEVQCIDAGLVREGPGIVRMSAISGPGVCGADFPFKVSVFGESAPIAFADDPRPPGAIPSGSPNWPIAKPKNASAAQEAPRYSTTPSRYESAPPDQPVSLNPPGAIEFAAECRPRGMIFAGLMALQRRRRRQAINPRALQILCARIFRLSLTSGDASCSRREHHANSAGAVTHAPLREPVQLEDSTHQPARRLEVPIRPNEPAPAMPVTVNPPATLACPIISELDHWISGAVQPAAMRWFGSPVAEIKQISAYSCRGMNGNPHARISEHAFGNALDIAAFTLADGRTITVKNGWRGLPEEQGFLRDVQSCRLRSIHHRARARLECLSLRPHSRGSHAPVQTVIAPAIRMRYPERKSPRAPATSSPRIGARNLRRPARLSFAGRSLSPSARAPPRTTTASPTALCRSRSPARTARIRLLGRLQTAVVASPR